MDFNYRKISHIAAFLAVLFAIFTIIGYPLLSFFGFFSTTTDLDMTEEMMLINSLITVLILIGTPLMWYKLVNKFRLKDSFRTLKLSGKDIDAAFLWGILAAIAMMVIILGFSSIIYAIGIDQTDMSNLPDLLRYLSPISMCFIIVVQSTGEEIFFRGFLFEKINIFAGETIAIVSTAILFGMAHMAYGKIYPVLMPMLMGLVLGYIVVKTKNLYSAITAHIAFNLISFIMYLLANSLNVQALIL